MLRLILIVIFVLAVLAVTFLPWWVILLGGVTLILLSKFLAKRFFLYLFSLPFRAKGKVLRGATVVVHRITPTEAPPPPAALLRLSHSRPGSQDTDEDEDEDEAEIQADEEWRDQDGLEDEPNVVRNYYEIEATITPRTPQGPFFYWDFTDLTLVKPGRLWYEDDHSCRVASVELAPDGIILQNRQRVDVDDLDEEESENEAEDDDGTKVCGPRRVKMLVGIKQGIPELVFSYYFENFGKLQLPSATT